MTAQQFKTSILNSPWAYIRDGVLSEGHLRLRFGWGGGGGDLFWEGVILKGIIIRNLRCMDRIPVSIRWFIFLMFCLSKPQLGCRVLPHLECLGKYSELFGHRQILPFVHKVKEDLHHVPEFPQRLTIPAPPTSGTAQRGFFISARVSSSSSPVTGKPKKPWKFEIASPASWLPDRVFDI